MWQPCESWRREIQKNWTETQALKIQCILYFYLGTKLLFFGFSGSHFIGWSRKLETCSPTQDRCCLYKWHRQHRWLMMKLIGGKRKRKYWDSRTGGQQQRKGRLPDLSGSVCLGSGPLFGSHHLSISSIDLLLFQRIFNFALPFLLQGFNSQLKGEMATVNLEFGQMQTFATQLHHFFSISITPSAMNVPLCQQRAITPAVQYDKNMKSLVKGRVCIHVLSEGGLPKC